MNCMQKELEMKILVTGSSGYSGNEIVKLLRSEGHSVIGMDILDGVNTQVIGSISDWKLLKEITNGLDIIIHTASLHAPHVGLYSREEFIDVNVQGTLKLLEIGKKKSIRKFIYTSTTSVYGEAMKNKNQAVWVTEELNPIPRDIYDITKLAAEKLCEDFYRNERLETICLRVARFWKEPLNNRVFYRMYRGLDVHDVAEAHKLAMNSNDIGFNIYNISSQTPFSYDELTELKINHKKVIRPKVPGLLEFFEEKNWEMPKEIDRVYVIDKARQELGYSPKFNIKEMLQKVR